MFLAGCFLPAHNWMTKQMFGWVWGNLFGVSFLYMFVVPTCTIQEPSLQFESLTSFEASLETGIPNSKRKVSREITSFACWKAFNFYERVGLTVLLPGVSRVSQGYVFTCLSKVKLEVPPASFHIFVLLKHISSEC